MRVLVGMSGGIDSSVAALLLKNAGHEVIGVTMSIWRQGHQVSQELKKHACFGPNEEEDIAEASRVSRLLGIEHHVLDCSDQYERIVLENFRNEYLAGKTPNPCIWCNSFIKFDALPKIAGQAGMQFDRFATGHYARVTHMDNRWMLHRAIDKRKDQSYFLYRLRQDQLAQVLFPLGTMTKEQAKRLCFENGLFWKDKEESQDFYSGSYRELLQIIPQKGEIVDKNGTVLGTHEGYWNYTIGQRRGLRIAADRPLYVIRIEASENRVVVGYSEDTFTNELIAEQLNWISIPSLESPLEVQAKIRSTGTPMPAMIQPIQSQRVLVQFAEKQRAVTSGQSVVFYDEDIVLGGGVIC